MSRLLPRSLLGQVLLTVAAALLVAQALSAILLYRAQEQRREAVALNSLAIQLSQDPAERLERRNLRQDGVARRQGRRGDRFGKPPPLQRSSLEDASPLRSGEARESEREAQLRETLLRQGVPVEDLVVALRDPREDPRLDRILERRGQFEGADRWISGKLVVAGLKRSDTDIWLVARAPLPRTEPRALGSIIVQTVLLYTVLVALLWFLLRRITRPLAALTHRVETFADTREAAGHLDPTGPEDTRRLIAAYNSMTDRIAGLLDEKDVMLGAIGHDLKTPLAALRVRIEAVESEAQRDKMAATIADLDRTLDDILSLARVGRPSDRAERTDLAALVASVIEEYEDRGKPVVLADAPRLPAIVRPTWLRRALRNLVSNAVRYGSHARVGLSRDGGMAVFRIEDDGPGIPQEQLAEMLEPFRRGEASRNRDTGGSGLGLTLARAIAQQHGGSLSLANRKDARGLVAELRIPID